MSGGEIDHQSLSVDAERRGEIFLEMDEYRIFCANKSRRL